MTHGDVTPIGLAASLTAVAVAVALSVALGLRLHRDILTASVRAIAQLLIVGLALRIVVDPHQPLAWSWLWVVLMTGYAGFVVRRRAPEAPGVLPLALAAFATSGVVTLGIIFGLGIFPLEGRAVVPLAGMMIGNSMTSAVVTARRIVETLRDQREEVEVRLALGQSASAAARPYLAASLRTAMTPQIETTRSVGLVFLPGAMTGLILAGVEPVDAVLVQAAVMFLILGAVATTSTVIGLGLARRLFTRDHRLVALPRPAQ